MSKFKKYWWFLAALFLFSAFVFFKSRSGVVLFGDNNISLWKENKYLLNPYLWIDNDYGYYFPLFIISFPFQVVFRLLNLAFDVSLVSNLYFYGAISFFLLTSLYLLRGINDKADKIDYLIIGLYSIASPLISSQLIGQSDICYSLAFINLFIGYLFRVFKKKNVTLDNVFILFLLILFVNLYILNTVLLLVILLFLLVVFHQRIVKEGKFKLVAALILFLGLNFFWIIAPLYTLISGLGIGESVGYDSLKTGLYVLVVSSNAVKAFTPFMIAPQYTTNTGNPFYFYSNIYVVSVTLFLFVLVIYENFLKREKDKQEKKILDCLLIVMLTFYVFSLGVKPYFKQFFWFFWKFIPFFSLFRAIVKFLFPMYFAFVILLILALKKVNERKKFKLLLLLLIAPLVLVYARPGFLWLTRNYQIPKDYLEFEKESKQEKLVGYYKVLPDRPSPGFAYTAFNWNPNGSDSSNVLLFYSRQDIAFRPLNAETIDSSIANLFCYKRIGSDSDIVQLSQVLGVLNIKKIVLQKDVRYSPCNFEMIEGYKKEQIGKLDIFIPKNEDFVPRIYIPQKVVETQENTDQLIEILSKQSTQGSLAVFFSKDSNELIKECLGQAGDKKEFPILEFRKITPVKYRVLVHRAPEVFPIVFSQSYHQYWRMYVKKFDHSLTKGIDRETADYQILEGNEDVQANKEELIDYVQKGWIASLVESSNSNIDFVSKNFKGTIQNDNLSKGRIYETWFSRFNKSIFEIFPESHYPVNGYANSWFIETQKVCSQRGFCKRNADGSYELEMIIEFWPQRLQYLGFIVSGLTVVGGLSYFFISHLLKILKK